jgi:fructose-1,6-bisphosphatase/inositol monophosphatase family enzyme
MMDQQEIELPTLDRVLEIAKEAAFLAGEQIRKAWPKRSEVKDKSSNTDLVTETDQQCEELIINLLRQTFPTHKIIGEESSGQDKYELSDQPTWTIDPIDGTTNFVHRLKLSCVLISYLVNKQVMVGVTYDPLADELFYAIKGNGAFLQSGKDGTAQPIHVSTTDSIPRSVVSMDPGYGRDPVGVNKFLSIQKCILLKGVRNIRVLGSTGLNMAYVACGRLDAAFEEGSWNGNRGPKIWDFAAGKLLIEEAGGITTNIEGIVPTTEPIELMGRSFFCAATPALATELMKSIKEGRQESG